MIIFLRQYTFLKTITFRWSPSGEFQPPASDLDAPVGFTDNPTKNSSLAQKDNKAMDIERLTVKVNEIIFHYSDSVG